MAVNGSRWQVLGRSPSHRAPRDAIDKDFFSPKWHGLPARVEDDKRNMPAPHKPPEPACSEAKHPFQNLVVNHGVVSSRSADSRRTTAHESDSSTGFPISHQRRFACTPHHRRFVALGRRISGESRVCRARTSTHIVSVAALLHFVKLRAREIDVSLGPDGGRILFSKTSSRDKLRASRQSDARINGQTDILLALNDEILDRVRQRRP
jgi:hypothetical protein